MNPPMMPQPKLKADALYLGDNGRVFCGALRCAGMTAHFTGHDLSGHRVSRITARITRAWLAEIGHAPECEGCKVQP